MNDSKPDQIELRKMKLETMLSEYRWLGQDQHLHTEIHRKDAQIFLTAIAALIALSSSNQSFVPLIIIYLIIPSLVFVYYMLQSINFHVVLFEAKQRAKIETRINAEFSDALMGWESNTVKVHLRNPFSVSILSVVSIFLIVFVIFITFAYKAFQAFGLWSFFLHFFEFALMIFVGIQWFRNKNLEIVPNSEVHNALGSAGAQPSNSSNPV